VSGSWHPHQLWVADITCVRLERGFAFLAVVLDVFSRKVIGYAIGPTLDARLPVAALDAAIESRQPPPGPRFAILVPLLPGAARRRSALGLHVTCGQSVRQAHVKSFMKSLKREEIYPRGYGTTADDSCAPSAVPRGHLRQQSAAFCLEHTFEADHAFTL
jgi:putative transposase